MATLHRLAAAEAGRRGALAPSYSVVREIVQALDPALVTLALEGPASYRDRHELVLRRRADRPNQIWQADHTQLDILISGATGKPDRPWLTTVMDDYSRALCGYTIFTGAPSALNTALALRQAIWRKSDPSWAMCGLPDILHVDHGSDFTSHYLERTAIELHVRIIHSTIGRPQGRGKIERFFGTINTEVLSTLPGHLGPGNRKPRPRSISRDWIAPSGASSPRTTTGPTAKLGSHHVMLGSLTVGFPGCPSPWRTSTDSSCPAANEVLLADFLVGRWHCKGDSSGEWDSDVQFFGADSNLVKAISPDVEFESSGVMTSYDGPGKKASVSRTDEWEYKDGALLLGQSYVKMPERIQVPGTTEAFLGLGDDPAKSSDTDARTELTFGPDSMTMKVAQYVDGHKALNQGQTVTCRK
ncbi:DDE-type integrase/transposase/recombinase [Arthrobacter oryzae]|uniref:DDE-type integrase/transposase/recombinase n=1 Tax=Arthrobacter oryzae TaxID=409290 RepID=UPI0027886EE8|nr:DDE-type integrase/transposase/recombinase [Arthrobacter oryzae]MDQ0078653.1 transposase InsO family protein [Arthrobacter oryzae]